MILGLGNLNIYTQNKNINLEWLLTFKDRNWNWNYLSMHPAPTLEWLDTFPNKDWNWNYIIRNKKSNNRMD